MFSTNQLLKRASNYLKFSLRCSLSTLSYLNKPAYRLPLAPQFGVSYKSLVFTSNAQFGSYPKHSFILLPALSPTMTQGTIAAWHIKVGQKINEGDNVFDVQTDKDSVPNVYQDEGGYVAKILVKEGEVVPTNAPVVVVVRKEADIAAFADFAVASQSQAPPAQEKPQSKPVAQVVAPSPATSTSASSCSSAPSTPSGGRVVASPYAKKLAEEKGVELNSVKGTGPNGRVISKDVLNAVVKPAPQVVQEQKVAPPPPKPKAPTPAPQVSGVATENYERIALTPMRRIIAERLVESKHNIPHFYLTVNIQMDNALSLRKLLNESSAVKISVNDLVVKATALASRDLPAVNSQWHGDHIRQFKHSDVSVAVSTKSGLITPIVFKAEQLGLSQIAAKTKELAEKARSSKLLPTEYQGGTITISNLGMYGIESFSAIINPPQSTILAVSTTTEKVVTDKSKDATSPFKTIQTMSVTLSCDHRVVDGALGAEWLQKFKGYLEKPLTMLL